MNVHVCVRTLETDSSSFWCLFYSGFLRKTSDSFVSHHQQLQKVGVLYDTTRSTLFLCLNLGRLFLGTAFLPTFSDPILSLLLTTVYSHAAKEG